MGKDGPTPTRRRARSTSCSTRSPESAARSRPGPRSCSRSERKPPACERPALSRLWESAVASLRVMRPRLTASARVALAPSAVRRTPLRSVSRSAVRLACTASSRAGALVAVARLALARLAVARLAAGLRAVERLAAGLLAALLEVRLLAALLEVGLLAARLAAGLLAALFAAGLRARLDDDRDDLGWGIRPPSGEQNAADPSTRPARVPTDRRAGGGRGRARRARAGRRAGAPRRRSRDRRAAGRAPRPARPRRVWPASRCRRAPPGRGTPRAGARTR